MQNRESMQYSNNYVEYLVQRKNDRQLLIKKVGIIALLTLLSVGGAVYILNSIFLPLMVIYP